VGKVLNMNVGKTLSFDYDTGNGIVTFVYTDTTDSTYVTM